MVGPRLAGWCLGPEGLDLAREWGWSQAISGPGKLELGLAGGGGGGGGGGRSQRQLAWEAFMRHHS